MHLFWFFRYCFGMGRPIPIIGILAVIYRYSANTNSPDFTRLVHANESRGGSPLDLLRRCCGSFQPGGILRIVQSVGDFLDGNRGFQMDIRPSFNYFTLGAWYTKTDTDMFESPKNRGTDQKGVYISFPFSLFKSQDKPGYLSYAVTSFTRDPCARVRQPTAFIP